jgi:transcription-repair coupling factor (superfamily II helicase)
VEFNTILSLYRNHSNTRQIISALNGSSINRIFLDGLIGSSDAIVLSSLFTELPHPAIFVLGDKEEAAYFQNDLENILGTHKALFYPSSYKKPYQIDQPDNNLVLQRAEVLTRINKSNDRFIIVTYPEAIHERVVTKKTLERNTIEIKVGEKVDIEFVTGFLQENNFERTDFVIEPGQFAIRGGIVDVFSFAHEMPYRIEFYGNSIESIRAFEPASQLSEQNMAFVTIIPNIQSGLISEAHESFFEFIPEPTATHNELFVSIDVP